MRNNPHIVDHGAGCLPSMDAPVFKLIEAGRERPTQRRAVACGTLYMNPDAFETIRSGQGPHGNALAHAESAGVIGAKKTPDLIPWRQAVPLDKVTLHYDLDEQNKSLTVYAQVAAFAKSGVEIEALSAVNAALLTLWDLIKGRDPDVSLQGVKVLVKTGGTGGCWTNPEGIPEWLRAQLPDPKVLKTAKAAIIVMSDRAAKGEYADDSGALLKTLLTTAGAAICAYEVIPDDRTKIAETLLRICRTQQPDILIASGGTGPGPRDITPDVLAEISDRMLDGLGDLLRAESLHYTDTAWLSRMTAAMVGATLVIAFPGSPKAVQECWDIIVPFIGGALQKIRKQGYEVIK